MKQAPAAKTDCRSPLLRHEWQYIEKVSLEEFNASDWEILNRQRDQYYAEEQARQVLRMLTETRDDPTFGYMVNNYRHCLQSATMAMRDGLDEEDIVVSLLHDIGFVTCPTMHGQFAAAMLGAYVSDRNGWMLRHHTIFQNFHCTELPGIDCDARARWRGHPHFEWTATFVAKYDQAATDPDYECAPIEVFEPMVKRLFSRAPRQRPYL
jgi:predicted HD phosphohydrolase